MIDITKKSTTLRTAIATAIVTVSKAETIAAVANKTVPKGDVLEVSRTAGLFAVKRTADMIPDCHPLPIEYTNIKYQIEGLNITIYCEVKTIYKTGVEVEAMHGASVVALTIYDMLKPIDKGVEISNIKLLEKSGGKSDYKDMPKPDLKVAIIVSSDSVSSGKKEDKAGKTIAEQLKKYNIQSAAYIIIPDDSDTIKNNVQKYIIADFDMVLITGGTGLSKRDITPEAVAPLIDRDIPGMMEAARNYGQQRMPYAMLSRGIAGFASNTLIITMPGSTRGAAETMDALFPYVFHLFKVKDGGGH